MSPRLPVLQVQLEVQRKKLWVRSKPHFQAPLSFRSIGISGWASHPDRPASALKHQTSQNVHHSTSLIQGRCKYKVMFITFHIVNSDQCTLYTGYEVLDIRRLPIFPKVIRCPGFLANISPTLLPCHLQIIKNLLRPWTGAQILLNR